MNKEKFKESCDSILLSEREKRGIGTLGEKTLHAILKNYFKSDKADQEVKIGSFVADIVLDEKIIEIQTRAFDRLRNKLEYFLSEYIVTVVYPIPSTKWLIWINEDTGEMSVRRRSPKQGRIYDIIPELYRIKQLLTHPNLRFCIIFLDMEEYRYLNGWSKDKKRGSTRFDRIPVDLIDEIYINSVSEYTMFLPSELPDIFTSKDYKNATFISMRNAQTALNVLNYLGVVERVDKKGKLYLYKRT